MLKTIYFFSIFWAGLFLSLLFLGVYYLLKILGLRKAEKRYVYYITSRWARFTLVTAGIKVNVSGTENIPGIQSGFVVISNHQGNFDIPVCVACMPFASGFVAKKELMKLPFISNWMKAIDCLAIDRDKARESREKLIYRIRHTGKTPMFLFPEGTRSRGPKMGTFRTGTLKLLFHDRIDVLPVTINGSYKCYEKNTNVRSAIVDVTIHPILQTSGYQEAEFEKFNLDLQKIIAGPL
jgi:1-acyl-sn-glycerol-3-phosphate acyltransferase